MIAFGQRDHLGCDRHVRPTAAHTLRLRTAPGTMLRPRVKERTMSVAGSSAGSGATEAAGRRALFGAAAGWLFDGYETYTLILVGAIALRELLPADQLSQLPLY